MTPQLSAEERAELRGLHPHHLVAGVCDICACGHDWPCDETRLLDDLDAKDATIAALEAEVARYREAIREHQETCPEYIETEVLL